MKWPEWIEVSIGKIIFDVIFYNFDSSYSLVFYINTNKIIEAITIVHSYYFQYECGKKLYLPSSETERLHVAFLPFQLNTNLAL